MRIEEEDLILFDDSALERLVEKIKEIVWNYQREDDPPVPECKRLREAQIRFFQALLRELVREKRKRERQYEFFEMELGMSSSTED